MTHTTPLYPTTPAQFTRLVCTQAHYTGRTDPADLVLQTVHTLAFLFALAIHDQPSANPAEVMISVCQSLTNSTPENVAE